MPLDHSITSGVKALVSIDTRNAGLNYNNFNYYCYYYLQRLFSNWTRWSSMVTSRILYNVCLFLSEWTGRWYC